MPQIGCVNSVRPLNPVFREILNYCLNELPENQSVMNYECIELFKTFVSNEVVPAVSELETIQEGSRKHIQKLIFTNLVDRFDSTVDHLILDNFTNQKLFDEISEKLKEPISEGMLLRIIASDSGRELYIEEKIRGALRNGILRERHSKKLRKLLETFSEEELNKPRVNPSNGKILTTFKIQQPSIPASILGYADWLYSKRNAVVHGGGIKMLINDKRQIKELYKVTVNDTIKLKLASINMAATFYQELFDKIPR